MQDLTLSVAASLAFGLCLSAMVLHSLGLPKGLPLATALTAATTVAVACLAGFLTWLVMEGRWQRAALLGVFYLLGALAGIVADPARRPAAALISAAGWIILPLAALAILRSTV